MVDATQIERSLGRGGTTIGDVFKVSVPRTDVRVTLDGFEIVPFMGLTSWAAFRRGPHGVTVMGDIVVLEDEINGAVSAAIDGAVYVTALHNHFVREQPRLMFMHIEATADEVTLARGVRRILDAIETVRQAHPRPRSTGKVSSTLSADRIEAIVAVKGDFQDGVLKFTLGRPDVPIVCTRCGNLDINTAMGYNTWAAFQGTDDHAGLCGDFTMLESEVHRVIGVLRTGTIEVIAVHNHMFFEEPRTIFLHYWGVGRAEDLARTFRRALDEQQRREHDQACHPS
jgi:hypothetical protein